MSQAVSNLLILVIKADINSLHISTLNKLHLFCLNRKRTTAIKKKGVHVKLNIIDLGSLILKNFFFF